MVSMLGGKNFASASNTIEFLADPVKAKAALDAHKRATEEHKQAAEEHRNTEARANLALESLSQTQAALSNKEKKLNTYAEELRLNTANLAVRESQVQEQTKANVREQGRIEAEYENAVKDAAKIMADAGVQADKILKDQQKIISQMTSEALEKDRQAEQNKTDWSNKLAAAKLIHVDAFERELVVSKREQLIVELANKLKG